MSSITYKTRSIQLLEEAKEHILEARKLIDHDDEISDEDIKEITLKMTHAFAYINPAIDKLLQVEKSSEINEDELEKLENEQLESETMLNPEDIDPDINPDDDELDDNPDDDDNDELDDNPDGDEDDDLEDNPDEDEDDLDDED